MSKKVRERKGMEWDREIKFVYLLLLVKLYRVISQPLGRGTFALDKHQSGKYSTERDSWNIQSLRNTSAKALVQGKENFYLNVANIIKIIHLNCIG